MGYFYCLLLIPPFISKSILSILEAVDTTETGDMKGVMGIGTSEVERGTLEVADTGVEDTLQADTEKIGKDLKSVSCSDLLVD